MGRSEKETLLVVRPSPKAEKVVGWWLCDMMGRSRSVVARRLPVQVSLRLEENERLGRYKTTPLHEGAYIHTYTMYVK